ncbi:MAG: DUF131 domain-containing protein [Sulfolobales archaeon]
MFFTGVGSTMPALQIMLAMIALAVTLILAGTIMMILSALGGEAEGTEKKRVEGGAVVVVGPVPIVLGTSERITKFLMVLAIALLALSVLFYLVISRGV